MEAMKEANLPVDSDSIVPCPTGTIEEGNEVIEKLLAKPNPPDGIFAGSDPTAMGAMKAIRKKGLKIPKDIAVVGFSNWLFSSLMDPPLSSVDQPGFEMGQEAAKLLIRHIEVKSKSDTEAPAETKMLKTKLIVRESSSKS
jgi:LacI family transcriptional regulator